MIQVDDRIGSIELIPVLQEMAPKLCKTVPVPPITSSRLLSGDVCFDGEGPNGMKTIIGIERKRLRDMLNSIRLGRYSGKQLPDMLKYYDETYLIIEGWFRCGITGDLETLVTKAHPLNETIGGRWFPVQLGNCTIRYTELDHFICTMQTHTRVHVRTAHTEYETSAEILSIYTHHLKPFDKHHAHQSLYTPQTLATIGKAGLVRKVAACLSGVGWERSGDVALKFRNVLEMCMAVPAEWETIKGIGKTLARRAYDQIRGEWHDPGEL